FICMSLRNVGNADFCEFRITTVRYPRKVVEKIVTAGSNHRWVGGYRLCGCLRILPSLRRANPDLGAACCQDQSSREAARERSQGGTPALRKRLCRGRGRFFPRGVVLPRR